MIHLTDEQAREIASLLRTLLTRVEPDHYADYSHVVDRHCAAIDLLTRQQPSGHASGEAAAGPWACPRCGSCDQVNCGRGDCRKNGHCLGLYCGDRCPFKGAQDHGETEARPCSDAICDHCGWRGWLPAKPQPAPPPSCGHAELLRETLAVLDGCSPITGEIRRRRQPLVDRLLAALSEADAGEWELVESVSVATKALQRGETLYRRASGGKGGAK